MFTSLLVSHAFNNWNPEPRLHFYKEGNGEAWKHLRRDIGEIPEHPFSEIPPYRINLEKVIISALYLIVLERVVYIKKKSLIQAICHSACDVKSFNSEVSILM